MQQHAVIRWTLHVCVWLSLVLALLASVSGPAGVPDAIRGTFVGVAWTSAVLFIRSAISPAVVERIRLFTPALVVDSALVGLIGLSVLLGLLYAAWSMLDKPLPPILSARLRRGEHGQESNGAQRWP